MHPVECVLFRYKLVPYNNMISTRIHGAKALRLTSNVAIPEFCSFSGEVIIKDFTTLGIHNMMFGQISIGKYCQIGAYVAIHGTNHPITHPSIYINYRFFSGELSKYKTSKPVKIGNDVWIGHGAIVLSGITIGDGCIIGAGSVVTRDVEPYSVVAGNPAKLLRKRFSDGIISELLELKWWDKTPDELRNMSKFFHTDLSMVQSIYDIIQR